MEKNKVVVFTKNNARIVVTDEIKHYERLPNALINPNLSQVKGIPPHFWKLENKKVVPMNRDEKLARLSDHEAFGVDNEIKFKKSVNFFTKRTFFYYWLPLTLTAVAFYAGRLVHG